MNQKTMAMRTFNLLLILVCLIAVVTFSNCEVKLDCESLRENNPALSISMFQRPTQTMTFFSETGKTLVLKKAAYSFNKPYTYTCESGGFMPGWSAPCQCVESFSAVYYLNDTIPFSMEISVYKPDNESATSSMDFTLAVASTYHYQRIEPGPAAVLQFVEEKLVNSKHIENVYFRYLWDIPIINDPHISRVIVEKNKGLTAIVYEGELYVLRRVWEFP